MSTLALPQPAGDTDVSMSFRTGLLAATLLQPLLAMSVLLPFWLAWGGEPMRLAFIRDFDLPTFVAGAIILTVIHEALHGLGFLWLGRVARREIHFGVHWKSLSPYAGCSAPMVASAYRGAVALPLLVQGVLPGIIAIAIGNATMAIWAAFMTAAAAGDVLVLWVIRSLPGGAMVVDQKERLGCRVVARNETMPAVAA